MRVGIKKKIEKRVEFKDTAAYYGSGYLEVFSTPAMIALMEQSAHLLASEWLSDKEDTVGTEVNIKHLRATLVGSTVFSEAELIEIDGRKLVFSVTASDDKGVIGTGSHTRYIIDPERFLSKLS